MTFTNKLKFFGTLIFALCFVLLTRRYKVNFFEAFFLLSTPSVLAYILGLVENIKNKL